MKCAHQCNVLKLSWGKWLEGIFKLRNVNRWEVWAIATILGAITLTMTLHHRFMRTASRIHDALFAWADNILSTKLSIFGASITVTLHGLLVYLIGLAIAFILVWGALLLLAKYNKEPLNKVLHVAYGYLPLAIIPSVGHVGSFLLHTYIPQIVAGLASIIPAATVKLEKGVAFIQIGNFKITATPLVI